MPFHFRRVVGKAKKRPNQMEFGGTFGNDLAHRQRVNLPLNRTVRPDALDGRAPRSFILLRVLQKAIVFQGKVRLEGTELLSCIVGFLLTFTGVPNGVAAATTYDLRDNIVRPEKAESTQKHVQ